MNNKSLVVCDRDSDYCTALSEYIRRSDCSYEVILYTEPEKFCEDNIGRDISVLLIQEGFLREVQDILAAGGFEPEICSGRQYVLSESRETSSEQGCIYKYQSAACIMGAIGEDIEAVHRIVNEAERCQGMKLTAVYSPVGHTLKTTFAMTLGQMIAEHQSVLYINLEGYNGLTDMLDIKSEYSLTDLMYDYSLRPDELSGILAQYVMRFDELNVLIPARSPFELQEIEPSMWLSFISSLAGTGRYQTVILDISDAVRGVFELLNVCTGIYMPVRKDVIAVSKLKDFDYVLSRYPAAGSIKSKLLKLKFPYFDDIDGTQLNHKNSRLGRYIRQEILSEQI